MDPRDRIEPKTSGEPETDVQPRQRFENPQSSNRSPSGDLWMHIALGVFIGLTAHSTLEFAYAKWEMRQAQQTFLHEMQKLQNYTRPR